MNEQFSGLLTRRERQYLSLLARGKVRPAIATEMGITVSTASVYHCTASMKLGITTRGLAAYAIKQGWGA
jgi:DNA-binding NarL/FixJ family response regulator